MKLEALGLLVGFGLLGCSGADAPTTQPTSQRKACSRNASCASSEGCVEGYCEPLWQGESTDGPGVRGLLVSTDHSIKSLLADRGNLYWVDRADYVDSIYKLSFTGRRQMLVGSYQIIRSFTVDADNAYFAGIGTPGSTLTLLESAPLDHYQPEGFVWSTTRSPRRRSM